MTIREIAEKLGVSPAAVSLVLNNKPGVGEKRRQLIQNAAGKWISITFS